VDLADNERFVGAKFWLINRAGATVFVSDRLRESFRSRAPIDRTRSRVIHNGVAFGGATGRTRVVRDELGLDPSDIVVTAIGHLRPPKGYDVFLRAARELASMSPHYRFVIAGQPEGDLLEELVALRDQLGLADIVHFAGFRPDIDNVLDSTDVYLITSSSEGFSLSAVQAMSRGVPVVATRCGGPEEIITHRTTGLLVDVGDVGGIAKAVSELWNDRALRERLASAAAVEVRERFGLGKMLDEYQQVYTSVIARS
jgi:glycosyltransferase involved in cell wall biosynthesis